MIEGIVPFSILAGLFGWFGRSKKADVDQQVLIQLRKAGSNLTKPHGIEFFLYFPTEFIAQQAATKIKELGFDVEVRRAAQGADWLCFSTKTIVPELPILQAVRRDLSGIASAFGGEYDGWGTPVVK